MQEAKEHRLFTSLRHRGHWMIRWHAIGEADPKPIRTLCGLPWMSEAHRTWDQTPSGGRCQHCEGLVAIASKPKAATFTSKDATSVTDLAQHYT